MEPVGLGATRSGWPRAAGRHFGAIVVEARLPHIVVHHGDSGGLQHGESWSISALQDPARMTLCSTAVDGGKTMLAACPGELSRERYRHTCTRHLQLHRRTHSVGIIRSRHRNNDHDSLQDDPRSHSTRFCVPCIHRIHRDPPELGCPRQKTKARRRTDATHRDPTTSRLRSNISGPADHGS